jgi:hypothetical protein
VIAARHGQNFIFFVKHSSRSKESSIEAEYNDRSITNQNEDQQPVSTAAMMRIGGTANLSPLIE